MRRIDLVDMMIIVGLVLLGAGLGAFDWRLALVVLGAVLLILALWLAGRAVG